MSDAMPKTARLVFTDLDGSLLDHHCDDWAQARTWLTRLGDAGVPVILVTSRTRAELMALRLDLGLGGAPFIAEGGAVIGLPPAWQHGRLDRDPNDIDGLRIKTLGVDIHFLRQRLPVLRERLAVAFRCLSELPLEEVVAETGLDEPRARLARVREGSMPLLWDDSEEALAAFREALRDDGLTLIRSGRCWHVMGDIDKGRAVHWLVARFSALRGAPPQTLGLGDGPDDAALLQAVDRASLIRAGHLHPVEIDHPALYRTSRLGPGGWAEGLAHWLEE